MRIQPWFLLAALAAVLAGCSGSEMPPHFGKTIIQNPGCSGLPAEEWLLGEWGTRNTRVTFQKAGGNITWTYIRDSGVMSERWGLKEPARGDGSVRRINGCEIEMGGFYSSFGGTQRALGTSMDFRMTYDGAGRLSGTGLGFGKEKFEVFWLKR